LFVDMRFKGFSGVVSCDVHNSKFAYVKKAGIFMDIQHGVENEELSDETEVEGIKFL
jgi:hypothetical protein